MSFMSFNHCTKLKCISTLSSNCFWVSILSHAPRAHVICHQHAPAAVHLPASARNGTVGAEVPHNAHPAREVLWVEVLVGVRITTGLVVRLQEEGWPPRLVCARARFTLVRRQSTRGKTKKSRNKITPQHAWIYRYRGIAQWHQRGSIAARALARISPGAARLGGVVGGGGSLWPPACAAGPSVCASCSALPSSLS